MSDPLSAILSASGDPYGSSEAQRVLAQALERYGAIATASVTESFLQRIVLLEMFMEEKLQTEISQEELETFLHANRPRINEETGQLAQIFYGKLATREG